MSFSSFINDIRHNQWAVYGAELYQDGKLTQRYGDTDQTRYPVYSATKTITAIAVGMAADEGKLDIRQPVLKYLPAEKVKRMTAEQQLLYQSITLKRLLTMSVAGYPFRPEGESWLESALQHPLNQPEKPQFDYSNVSAYLVGVAAACALDEDLYCYLNRRLFTPLGIVNPPCGRCPDGYFYGASQMALTVNELSRIGLMLNNGGMYEKQRILSDAYVKEAVSIQQMNREGGYGYFIWKYREGFSINGKWGQKCYVLPSKGMMITYLSHMEHGADAVRKSMEANLLD